MLIRYSYNTISLHFTILLKDLLLRRGQRRGQGDKGTRGVIRWRFKTRLTTQATEYEDLVGA